MASPAAPQRPVKTVIDPELCVGCGECVKVCPTRALAMAEGKAVVVGDRSLYCGHCQAACPAGAVTVELLARESTALAGLGAGEKWLAPGDFDASALARLMLSRRSTRNYQDKPVPREMLEQLVAAGMSAPSGSNRQRWSYTILPTRQAVLAAAEPMGDFFRQLNAKAEKAWLRRLMALMGRPELERYYQEHHATAVEALAEWEATGVERLFHGATAAILVGSLPGAATGAEDALLATGQILLMAHALGLGTCLVGFAVAVLPRLPRLREKLGLEPGENIRAVIALGWPEETYQRPARRLPAPIRWRLG